MKPYYQDEYVTLYCGDCREIVPTLCKFDLLLTDPPYGLPKDSSNGRGKLKNRSFNEGNIQTWDIAPDGITLALLMKSAVQHIIWGGNYFELPPCRCFVVWDKCQPWDNFSKCEYAWTSIVKPAKLFKLDTRSYKKIHPTQKPIQLMEYCIEKVADKETVTVFDPFAGSGTTGVAAKRLNRKCTLIEKEEKYCEIAARRLSQGVLPLFEQEVE
jgi:site-specific DNA-methyltransferase (adenine-specific)